MSEFDRLTREGLAMGLDRAGAEKRARDILFDDAVSDGGLEENARDSHESSRKNSRRASKDFGDAFASAEELWSKLQTTWESRGQQGVELVTASKCRCCRQGQGRYESPKCR